MSAIASIRQRLEESPRLRLMALGASIALIALVVWLIAFRGDDGPVGPVAMSVQELADFAGEHDHPVYWAGERPGRTYEVTETSDGNVFVRYLAPEAEVGDERPDFLTVGTYPMDDAYEVTTSASRADGAITGRSHDGALVVTNESAPTSVYLAYPGDDVQVEVYDPDAERTMRIATSGDVQPIR